VHRLRLKELLFAAVIALIASTASAAPRDAAAQKKIDEAINTHYLATDFDKAEAVLTGTINACGDKCSPAIIGKAWMYVGIVRGSGKNDQKGSREAFQKALAADPKVALDDALATPETKKLFAEVTGGGAVTPPTPPNTGGAGGEGGEGGEGGKGPKAAGEMECEPKITEVETRRPVPISCTTEEDATKAELKYKEFGGEDWKTVPMQKKGDSFQATMPCGATMLAGKLRFYVRAQDAAGDTVDTYGSKSKPVELDVVGKTDQDAPSFPDKDPPPRCQEAEECPPDFPGCKKAGGGTKGWGASCAASDECEAGLACVEGTCEQSQTCDVDADCPSGNKCNAGKCEEGASGPYKKNWLGIHVAYDLAIVGGTDVCSKASQENEGFACFEQGTENQFNADPQPGQANKISTGMAPATLRFLLSFDRAITANIMAGARLGYAINGGPAAGENGETKFLPFHAEIRGSYWFGKSPLSRKGLRPYVFLGGGLAQVDAKLPVTVVDCSKPVAGSNPQTCANPPAGNTAILGETKSLDAYKKLGQSFIALGGGAVYALTPNSGLQLNLNIMFMLPTTGQVIEPSLGYVFGL
jgi:hypothetical protein